MAPFSTGESFSSLCLCEFRFVGRSNIGGGTMIERGGGSQQQYNINSVLKGIGVGGISFERPATDITSPVVIPSRGDHEVNLKLAVME
jgi:hypothetical protein